MTLDRIPDLMPVLSRGKHRSPRKGACFMELASYLAGERWGDHPACTHPLLAALARDVNDHVDDRHRPRLAPLIPTVIGLRTEDPRADAWIARNAALAALPVVSAAKQGVAAVGLLASERHLNLLEGRAAGDLSPQVRRALDTTPQARDWAQRFPGAARGSLTTYRRRGAPVIVHSAVSGIATACVDDAQERLVTLLEQTVEDCRGWFGHTDTTPVDTARWDEAVALTRR